MVPLITVILILIIAQYKVNLFLIVTWNSIFFYSHQISNELLGSMRLTVLFMHVCTNNLTLVLNNLKFFLKFKIVKTRKTVVSIQNSDIEARINALKVLNYLQLSNYLQN